jgi:hypothetical protein
MLFLIDLAAAHPATLPHSHDPAALALVAFWALGGAAFLSWAFRRTAGEAAASEG